MIRRRSVVGRGHEGRGGGSMVWLHGRNLGEGVLGGGGSMAWLHRRNLGEGILKPDGGSMLTQYWPR